MDYSSLSKSQLWSLVKEAQLTALTWQSTKQQMIDSLVALEETENNKANEYVVITPSLDGDFSVWNQITSGVIPNSDTVEETKEQVTTPPVPEVEIEIKPPLDTTYFSDSNIVSSTSKYPLLTYILKSVLAEYIALAVYLYAETSYVAKTLLSIKLVVTPTKLFAWYYIDHAVSGGYKPVTDKYDKRDLLELLETLNSILPDVKKFDYSRSVVSIKMKPKTIVVEGVNDQKIKRTEKQKQVNNGYGNRRKTIMDTTESPGRNVGQPSVKESVLFRAARFLSEPFIRDGKANVEGIDTISVNGIQVYPCSLISALPENHPAIDKLSPQAIKFLFDHKKTDDPLTDAQVAEVKTYKRRKDIAQQKVSQRSFTHLRGKIHNGFSPSFKDGDKTFCFELDKTNRVRLWSLPHGDVAGETPHNVSANDLVNGRLLQDVGYLEVLEFSHKQWRNLTLDMVRGGSEARLERFNWISEKLNLVSLDNVNAITTFLNELKTLDGKPLKIHDLKVSNELISGELYGSKLLIAKRDTVKHKVVLHPNAKCPERIVAVANTWVLSLPGNLLNSKFVLGLNNITTKTRISDCVKPNRNVKPISNKSDLKYITKMLTRFTGEGIFKDRDKTEYLGRLVLTDGESLTKKQITRIAQRVLDTYPPTEKLACLFTPTLLVSNDNYAVTLLKLLRTYGGVELAVLNNGNLTHYNDNTDKPFTQWCNSVYRYLMSYGKAVTAITLNDAIQMLERSPFSEHKQILINGVPTKAKLNGGLMLKDCTD